MSSTEIIFRVVDETNCPYYKADDEFKLSGNALSLELDKEQTFISTAIVRFPDGRTACRILIGDLTNVLVQYKNIDKIPPVEMECSGCSGLVRVQMGNKNRSTLHSTTDSASEKNDLIASLLSNFSIFESINEFNSQMSATELLQALELSQKSGKLTLTLPQGSAQLLINGGNLIRADYCNKAGKEAVFEILKEREGRFTFSPDLPEDQLDAPKIGSLMEILLDASRMIDEEGGDYECGSSLGCHAGG